jgi:hypothetical protein
MWTDNDKRRAFNEFTMRLHSCFIELFLVLPTPSDKPKGDDNKSKKCKSSYHTSGNGAAVRSLL